ncbi:MAG: hypothetical protein Q9162_001693 [Coniocarpon cinnabarinum]
MAASNILNLDFRRTHAVSLSAAIKQYISTKYDQHPDMFTADFETIEKLRTDAVTVLEPHNSGIRRVQLYVAQLVWLTTKFPIDIGADFTWYSSLGYQNNTAFSQNNLKFELANIIFNQGVLYCQIAATSNRSTADGLKTAANFFCLSAGVWSHLQNEIIPGMQSTAPDDMDPATLECLQQLMLAQAQECFWQKAVKDNMKDGIIAKLAAKVTDLYQVAADWGVKSETISSEWIHHMSAKHHHFAAAAQFRAACDCLERRKYGEEIARLRDSLTCAGEGLKEARYISKSVSGDLNGLKMKVQDDLKRAEKDNDVIYLQPVPTKTELQTLERASMVKPNITKGLAEPVAQMGENGPLGKPLFAKLVPYSVHIAASIYENRRDQKVNGILQELEMLNASIHDTLKSLNLPGSLQALEKPLGLPPGIVSHAEEIRQQNGLHRLSRTLDDIDKLRSSDKSTFQEGKNILQVEAAEDNAARKKYGTDRWARSDSHQAANHLYGQATDIEGYFKAAESSDSTVREKMQANEALIRLLNGTDRDLEDFVPSSKRVKLNVQTEKDITRVRDGLNRLSRLQTRRKQKVESLRSKAQADDVNPELIKEASRLECQNPMERLEAVQFEDFFDQRLERYNVDKKLPREEQQEQQDLLSQLKEANAAFVAAKSGDMSTKDREQALQRLDNAYFAFKEIIQNLDVGRKFYNDLAPIAAKFRDDCRTFGYSRRAEATQLESDIVNALPMSSLHMQASPPPTELSPQRQPRTHTGNQQHAYVDRPPPREAPLTAPKPVKPSNPIAMHETPPEEDAVDGPDPSGVGIWSPEKGIKFGRDQPSGTKTNGAAGPGTDGRWDPSRGMRFG